MRGPLLEGCVFPPTFKSGRPDRSSGRRRMRTSSQLQRRSQESGDEAAGAEKLASSSAGSPGEPIRQAVQAGGSLQGNDSRDASSTRSRGRSSIGSLSSGRAAGEALRSTAFRGETGLRAGAFRGGGGGAAGSGGGLGPGRGRCGGRAVSAGGSLAGKDSIEASSTCASAEGDGGAGDSWGSGVGWVMQRSGPTRRPAPAQTRPAPAGIADRQSPVSCCFAQSVA